MQVMEEDFHFILVVARTGSDNQSAELFVGQNV